MFSLYIEKHSIIFHLFFLGILVILFNVSLLDRFYQPEDELAPDPLLYYETAKTIAAGNSYIEKFDHDIGYRIAPGYSYLVAIIFYVFGEEIQNGFFLNIFFHVCIAFVLFYLSSKLTNIYFAWGYSLMLLAYYPIWRMNFSIMIEISSIFAIAWLLLFLLKYLESQRIRFLWCFALMAGTLIFLNNRFVFHFFIISVAFFIYSFLTKRIRLRDAFILGFGIFLVMLPWHIRQYKHYHQIIIFSPEMTQRIGINIGAVENNNSEKETVATVSRSFQHSIIRSYEEYLTGFTTQTGINEKRMDEIKQKFTEEKFSQMVDDYYHKYEKEYNKTLSRLTGFWQVWQFDFRFNFGGDTRIIPPARLVANLINIIFLTPVFLLFPVGIFYAIKRKDIFLQFVVVIVLTHWVLHALIYYIPRYRITVLPLIFFVSWYALYQLCKVIVPLVIERWPVFESFQPTRKNHTGLYEA